MIRDELEALIDTNGVLHPRTVVEWARSHPNSDLGRSFDWDVERAAFAHWMDQARHLIQIHLVDVQEHRETFSLQSDQRRGGGYRSVDVVFSTASMRAEAVKMAWQELRRWRERYFHLVPELSAVFRCIDRLSAGFGGSSPPPDPPGRGRGRGGGRPGGPPPPV
jgi:hypothetical protein